MRGLGRRHSLAAAQVGRNRLGLPRTFRCFLRGFESQVVRARKRERVKRGRAVVASCPSTTSSTAPPTSNTMETDAGDFAINDNNPAAPVVTKAPSAGPAGPSFGLPPKLEVSPPCWRDRSYWSGRRPRQEWNTRELAGRDTTTSAHPPPVASWLLTSPLPSHSPSSFSPSLHAERVWQTWSARR